MQRCAYTPVFFCAHIVHATWKCGQTLVPRKASGTDQAQYMCIYVHICFLYAEIVYDSFFRARLTRATWRCGKPILPRSGSSTEPRPPSFSAATLCCDSSSYDTFGPRGPAMGEGELRPDFRRRSDSKRGGVVLHGYSSTSAG